MSTREEGWLLRQADQVRRSQLALALSRIAADTVIERATEDEIEKAEQWLLEDYARFAVGR